MDSKQEYTKAKRARLKVKEVAQIELMRQIKRLKETHQRELIELKDM